MVQIFCKLNDCAIQVYDSEAPSYQGNMAGVGLNVGTNSGLPNVKPMYSHGVSALKRKEPTHIFSEKELVDIVNSLRG